MVSQYPMRRTQIPTARSAPAPNNFDRYSIEDADPASVNATRLDSQPFLRPKMSFDNLTLDPLRITAPHSSRGPGNITGNTRSDPRCSRFADCGRLSRHFPSVNGRRIFGDIPYATTLPVDSINNAAPGNLPATPTGCQQPLINGTSAAPAALAKQAIADNHAGNLSVMLPAEDR